MAERKPHLLHYFRPQRDDASRCDLCGILQTHHHLYAELSGLLDDAASDLWVTRTGEAQHG